jgi:hypothetical protein
MKLLITLIASVLFPGRIIYVECEKNAVHYAEYSPKWGDYSFTQVILFYEGEVYSVDTVIGKMNWSKEPFVNNPWSYPYGDADNTDTCYWSLSYVNTDSSNIYIDCKSYIKRLNRPGYALNKMGRAYPISDWGEGLDPAISYDTIKYGYYQIQFIAE